MKLLPLVMVFNQLSIGSGFIPGSVYVLGPRQPLFSSLSYLIEVNIFGGFSRTQWWIVLHVLQSRGLCCSNSHWVVPAPNAHWMLGQGKVNQASWPGGLWPDSLQVASVTSTHVPLALARSSVTEPQLNRRGGWEATFVVLRKRKWNGKDIVLSVSVSWFL